MLTVKGKQGGFQVEWMAMMLFKLTRYVWRVHDCIIDDCDRDGNQWDVDEDDYADYDVDPVWQCIAADDDNLDSAILGKLGPGLMGPGQLGP